MHAVEQRIGEQKIKATAHFMSSHNNLVFSLLTLQVFYFQQTWLLHTAVFAYNVSYAFQILG